MPKPENTLQYDHLYFTLRCEYPKLLFMQPSPKALSTR